MKTGGEFLKVDATPIAADGSKLEPEERAALEATSLPVEVTLSDHAVRPDVASPQETQGAMRGMIGVETTAGEVAQATATRCEVCTHWRRDDWGKHLAAIADTHDGQIQIDALRGELLGRNEEAMKDGISEDDLIATNITIQREFGICAAFTESEGMVVASPFYGGCPEDDQRFKMRDREAKAIASAGYDKILRMAQGRKE